VFVDCAKRGLTPFGACECHNRGVSGVDDLALAESLIGYDTSTEEGIRSAVGFLQGWLEGQGIGHSVVEVNGRPAIVAAVGAGPRTLILSSHVDVVPGHPDQFTPLRENGSLYGRGAYDMKGALAAMLAALADLAPDPAALAGARVKLLIAPDEESDAASIDAKATARLADAGNLGEFAICGEPTDLHIGVQAKGALVVRFDVRGRSAHGSTPWLGQNAVLKAIDLYHRIGELPFASERSELFEGPSVSLGRIAGGQAVNAVPDHCRMDLDIRHLPTQDPDDVMRQVRSLDPDATLLYQVPAAQLNPHNDHVKLLRTVVREHRDGKAIGVGRHGASDAVLFLARGIPSVEFGPAGAGHHGPDEHVDIASLATYRRILVGFARALAAAQLG
jgi:succinyl-diaminopimelate desuccinylase